MAQTLAEALDVPFSLRTPEYERYAVTGDLGEGGMGRVYRAHDTKLNRDVAIKVMTVDDGREEEDLADLRARFYREAKIVAALRHPNVLQIIDYSGADAPVPFIVTELLEGVDLDSLICTAPLPEKVAAAICYGVVMALGHAHEHEIIHRDVKPHNVFIERDGRVVLIDFGVAKGLRSTNTRVTFMKSRTKVVGTVLFSSPEQMRSQAAPGPASDLFSVGAMMYYAMSQVLPFPGTTAQDVMLKLMSAEPMDLRNLTNCSEVAWRLIHQLLEKTPQARPTGGEAANALKTLAMDSRYASTQEAIAAYVNSLEARLAATTAEVPEVTAVRATEFPTAVLPQLTASGPTAMPTRVFQDDERTKPGVALQRTAVKHARSAPRTDVVVAGFAVLAIALIVLIAWPNQRQVVAIDAPPPASPPSEPAVSVPIPAARANLRVLVKPWGKVSVDGVERGTTPAFRIVELPLGKHQVLVTNPDFGRRETTVLLSAPNREETLIVDFGSPR